MEQFYRLRAPGQPLDTVVVVAEDKEAGILLRWVPNLDLWLRAHSLENDFLFGDDGGTYEPISPREAGKLMARVKPFDERYDGARRLMSQYRALPPAEQRTNAEMGLSRKMTGKKWMSAAGLPELLRRSRGWRTVARYEKEAGSAPREFVRSWSHEKRPLGLPGMKFRVATSRDRHPIVQAKAVPPASSSASETATRRNKR